MASAAGGGKSGGSSSVKTKPKTKMGSTYTHAAPF